MMRLLWSESSDSVAYTIRPAGRGHAVSLLPAASDLCVLCLSDEVFCDTEGPSDAVLAETLVPFQGGFELSDSDPVETKSILWSHSDGVLSVFRELAVF